VQATTPLDPRVLDAMLPFMTEQFGNPHSRTHLYGWESEEAVERARAQVGRQDRTKDMLLLPSASWGPATQLSGFA
jgi:cysteine sulfinate desulfinase/cysteine desulfurase-like protein